MKVSVLFKFVIIEIDIRGDFFLAKITILFSFDGILSDFESSCYGMFYFCFVLLEVFLKEVSCDFR